MCNGSTTDFDSVSLGSIPSPGAKSRQHGTLSVSLARRQRGRGRLTVKKDSHDVSETRTAGVMITSEETNYTDRVTTHVGAKWIP